MLKNVKSGLARVLPLLAASMKTALVMYSHGVGTPMATSATSRLVECHKRFGGVPRPSWWHSTIFGGPLCRLSSYPSSCPVSPFVASSGMKKELNSLCTLLAYSSTPLRGRSVPKGRARNSGFAEVTCARAYKKEKLRLSLCTLLAYS